MSKPTSSGFRYTRWNQFVQLVTNCFARPLSDFRQLFAAMPEIWPTAAYRPKHTHTFYSFKCFLSFLVGWREVTPPENTRSSLRHYLIFCWFCTVVLTCQDFKASYILTCFSQKDWLVCTVPLPTQLVQEYKQKVHSRGGNTMDTPPFHTCVWLIMTLAGPGMSSWKLRSHWFTSLWGITFKACTFAYHMMK